MGATVLRGKFPGKVLLSGAKGWEPTHQTFSTSLAVYLWTHSMLPFFPSALEEHPLMSLLQDVEQRKASVRQDVNLDVSSGHKRLSGLRAPLTADLPPDLASAHQVPAGSRHACRTNGSLCCCVVEAVLSIVVFVYALKGAVEIVENQDVARGCFLFPPVVLCIGCAVWTGVSHSIWAPRVQGAVDAIVSANAREVDRLGPVAWADSPSLDGVDLFSYHDVMSLSLNVLKVVSAWLLLQALSLGLTLCVVVYLLLAFTLATDAYWLLAVFVPLWLGTYARVMYKYGVVGRTWKLGEACRTQPFHSHVRPVLLVSSLVYAVLLYLSPVPAAWYWSLIATHTARALMVFFSLRWQSEGMAEGGVVAEDLLYGVSVGDGGES